LRVHVSTPAALVGGAVLLACFSGVVTLVSRRRGDRSSGVALLIGMPGLFLSLWASLTSVRWLYIPAGMLVAGAYGAQFAGARRQRHRDLTFGQGPDDPSGGAP
jgi:hypothetical protein